MILDKIKKNISSQYFFTALFPWVVFNVLVSMIISFPLLRSENLRNDVPQILISSIPFTAHYFSLNLLVGLITYCLFLVIGRRLASSLGTVLFLSLQTILFLDTKIYAIFRYHINPLVLNVITTEGVSDSVILGKATVATFSAVLLGVLFLEIMVSRYLGNFDKDPALRKHFRFDKASRVLFFAGLCFIAVDKGVYAYGDLVNNTAITRNAKLFPFYQPFTIKRLASNVLHIKVDRELDFKVSAASTLLHYPKKAVRFDPLRNKKYNIVVIVIDGLRFDMLNEDTMPNVWAFGQQNIRCLNHYSGGNGTRFGIFSLMYGIEGAYWHTFLAQRISPVLIDALIDRGYEFKVLSSTRLTFPEFRKTAFLRIPESIEDKVTKGNAAEKDKVITEKCIEYISTRKSKKPFFAFVFYDASHQPYFFPKEFEKYRPAGDNAINYLKPPDKDEILIYKNRFKNAIHYDDYLAGEIIASLKKNGLLDNSIVLITGDHGEEFYENGYFGHTSSFDDYQTKTAFVLHYPGAGRYVIERITSHSDFVPTLMGSLGCISPSEDYSHGISLFNKTPHPFVTCANWDTSAIIDDEYKTVFSTELYRMRSFEVRKKNDYSLVENQSAAIKQRKQHLIDTSLRMSDFYR